MRQAVKWRVQPGTVTGTEVSIHPALRQISLKPGCRPGFAMGPRRLCIQTNAGNVDNIAHPITFVLDAWRGQVFDPGKQLVFAALLVLLGAYMGWRSSWPRRAADAAESVTATLAIININLVLTPVVWLLSEHFKALYALLGIPSVPGSVWEGLPLWLLSLIAILAQDFANYWNHRAMHLKWLWPVHAIHHSDPVVNGLTAYRIHILEALVMWGSYIIMLTWLGMPADAIGVGALLLTFHNVYVHINVDWGHGPLRLLVASPRFHRWHHADVPEAHGKNLANVFPFFDWMFGTYRVPGPCDTPVGAAGIPRNDVVKLTLWPLLEWARLASLWVEAMRVRIVGWLARGAGLGKAMPFDIKADQNCVNYGNAAVNRADPTGG
ncbi:sterol desaturase family protein [Afipia sp. GAS231]|uniref:sterol desaturase family protein n=1 Tax=Afipia sp. GAS231 TaxID=1882747 RepID=UPI000B8821C4|nr:sterol desaturase family protein [Afipia sp. GAS231]